MLGILSIAGFHGSTHGTTVNYIDGMIGAMIDTTQTKIGFAGAIFYQRPVLHNLPVYRLFAMLPHLQKYPTLFIRSGWPIVMACPMPLCGLSGATTTTFAKTFYCFYQVTYTRCRYAIIIGD